MPDINGLPGPHLRRVTAKDCEKNFCTLHMLRGTLDMLLFGGGGGGGFLLPCPGRQEKERKEQQINPGGRKRAGCPRRRLLPPALPAPRPTHPGGRSQARPRLLRGLREARRGACGGRAMLAAARGLILAGASLGVPLVRRGLRLSAPLETCIVERWWKVPLSKVGREPRIKHRRYKVYRLLEDTKHKPKEPLELILTQTVDDVGSRGDTVLVPKSFGRSRLLNLNKAVYASPENKKIFEEENRLRQEGKLPRLQTHTGEKTVRFLRKCTLEVGVNDCEQFELTHEIVARHFLRNLGVVVLPHALKLPDEPITELGEYWCEVTVNDLDTVRVPLSVVRFAEPKPESYRVWLAQPEDAPQQ